MKLRATRALAAIALIAGLTTLSPSAHAQTLVLTCNAAQAHPTDSDIIIENHEATDGPCTISVPLNPKHALVIDADGPVITQAITLQPASSANGTALFGSYGNIWIKTPSTVKTGAIKATPVVESGGGYIAIQAGDTVSTGTITTVLGGWVAIQSQMNGGNVPFVIGTTGTNGVGKISTSGNNLSQQSGVSYLLQGSAVIYVSNGSTGSTGGISLTAATSVNTPSGGGSRGVVLTLDAKNGPIHIPAGTINVSGSTSSTPAVVGGGVINLLANEIDFSGTVTLNANSGASAGPFNNQINLSASKVTYGTLTLEADGNGVAKNAPSIPEDYPSLVGIFSQNYLTGSLTPISDGNGELNTLNLTVSESGAPIGPLTLTGTGALTAHASGDLAEVAIVGLGYSLSGTTVSLTSNGAANHGIYLSNNTAGSSITFGNSGAVTLTANGLANPYSPTTTGGFIYIDSDALAFNAKTFVISANGPATGNGDGGIVDIESTNLTTGGAFVGVKIATNGAPAGTGNAQKALVIPLLNSSRMFSAINIVAGDQSTINLGDGATLQTFNLSANGGKTDGNGGKIQVTAGNLSAKNVLSVDAAALGKTGSGGDIELLASAAQKPTLTFAYNAKPVLVLNASGGTTSGIGGVINIPFATLSDNTKTINVNALMNVSGGTGLSTAAFDGSISLNSVTCQQWSTAKPTWPLSWWDCVTTGTPDKPGAPVDPEQVAVGNAQSVAFDKVRTKLKTNNVQLHVFHDNIAYNNFYQDVVPRADGSGNGQPAAAGSITLNPAGGPTDVTVWERGTIGDPTVIDSFTDAQLLEVSSHEFGHAVDLVNGLPSASATYALYLQRDIFDLNNVVDPSSPTGYTPRNPCVATIYHNGTVDNVDMPPFAGVVDLAGGAPYQMVCISGSLSPKFAGASNDLILINIEALWRNVAEINAQTFSYEATGNQGARPVNDRVLENGGIKTAAPRYFGCVEGYAKAQLAGNAGGPTAVPKTPSGACNKKP